MCNRYANDATACFFAVWVRLAADIPPRAAGAPQDLVERSASCGETRKDIVPSAQGLTRTFGFSSRKKVARLLLVHIRRIARRRPDPTGARAPGR